jgi:uncharacterized protein YPO0396
MKRLTKVRLINWHYFSNETIHIKNNALITGQNATGKSTIVDAIAFVITAGDQIFNMAANEKSKRDLRGYVKCKLGIDNQEYLRVGDVTGHVALEFYDERIKAYFTVGTVIDVFGDVVPPKVIFYEMDKPLTDALFIDDQSRILTTLNFKKSHKSEKIYLTRREAKLAFRHRFGSINETYFSLLPKALAFKPIADVKDFIYHYLLEEKTLDVEAIKESIHSYRDLEATLKVIKQKISDLQDMKVTYEEIQKNQDQKRFFEFLLKIIDLENTKHVIQGKIKQLEKLNISTERLKAEISGLDSQIEALDERGKEIYSLMQSDDTFKSAELYDREIISLNSKIEEQKEIQRFYLQRVSKLKPMIQELKTEYGDKLYDELSKIDYANVTGPNVDKVKLALSEIDKRLREKTEASMKVIGKAETTKQDLLVEINDIYQALKDLENHKLRYNPMIKEMQKRIIEGVKNRYGVDISVHILAELIEVTDKRWHNTIEDFLGAQRFNLIVEPRYFDEALQVYNRIKDQMNLSSVGLVNTKKIAQFINHQPKSLASIITSDNVDAKHYVNMTCGNLIMVDDVLELENYNQAITVEGMIYRSYTVRSLNKNTEKPFIGKNAHDMQLEKWREMAISSKDRYAKVNDEITRYNQENDLIGQLNLKTIIDYCGAGVALENYVTQLNNLNEKKHHLPEGNLNELRVEYERTRDEIRSINNQKRKIYEETGKLRSDEIKINEELVILESKQKTVRNELNELTKENLNLEQDAYNLYNQEIQNAKDMQKVENDYRKRIEVELGNLTNLEDSLKNKQFKYTNTFNLGYPYGFEHMNFYLTELNKLIKSELVKYESKVREAREAAEKLFKEDFIAKLRNYIISAQDEITKINMTLKTIHFGEDTYEFIFPKSKDYAEYYEMVLSEDSLKTGTEIFNYDFEMKYQRQLEELFINLAAEDLNSNGAINKFTDYRTYMDYDIKIRNNSGETILYSKVFKEKSGGETQVPFYVATLASFVRVFQQATRANVSDSIGLILFDEVFDKMDTSRIKSMMEFIKQLPVQIVLATPPQKMEVLSKYTDTTVVTMREGKAARAYEVVQKY